MGQDIVSRQLEAAWGSGFFEQLSRDLRSEFPDLQGFSATNLKYCKRFYLFYTQQDGIRYQVGSEIRQQVADKRQLVEAKQDIIRQQLGDEFEISPLFQIPWRHHVEIITKCKTVAEALFYVRKTIENGWSRAVLTHFMEADLFAAQGKAQSNFSRLLPEAQSDLAREVLKDPYTVYYVAAVNKQLKAEVDNPTLGILICKTKDAVDVQYALESSSQPIGISEYQLSKLLPDDYKSALPSIEEIEEKLKEL
jgi:hypothetical protein